jgi:ABC-2 type transport system ATP-binding protein
MVKSVINTKNLTKKFGKVVAVENVSLNINEGEIYGFLGLNGAGKTTIIRMLLGMIGPTLGSSYIYGKEVNAGNYKLWKNIGYLVEAPYSYSDMTVYENLNISRLIHGVKDKMIIDEVIDKLKLTKYKDRKAGTLSLGNSQRLGLAKALINKPDILLLDEPTNGLDPAGIVEIRELLKDLAYNNGVTIFISSHILAEISKIATRIGIIHGGRLLQELQVKQLEEISRRRLIVKTSDPKSAEMKIADSGYQNIAVTDTGLEIDDDRAIENPDKIAKLIVNANLPLYALNIEKEDLETYFLRIINGETVT